MPRLLGGVLNPGRRPAQIVGALQSMRQQDKAQRKYEADADRLRADSLDYARQIVPETLNTYDDSAMQQRDALRQLRRSQRRGVAQQSRLSANRLADRTGAVMGDFERGAGEYQANLGNFMSNFGGDTGALLQGYQDRYNTATADLQGYGDQMKTDIDKAFAEKEAAAMADLGERGWANSTATAGVSADFAKERSAEQRRLGEDLTRMRTGLRADLSGDMLNAQGGRMSEGSGYGYGGMGQMLTNDMARANMRAGLTGDEANAANQWGLFGLQNDAAMGGAEANFWGGNAANRSNIVSNGMGTYLNTLTDYNLIPPESNAGQMQQFGANMVQGPQDNRNWFEKYAAPALPGVGSAAGSYFAGGAPTYANVGMNTPGSLASALPPNGVASKARPQTRMSRLAAQPRRGGLSTKRFVGAR